MRTVRLDTKLYRVPSKWEEVSRAQFLRMVPYLVGINTPRTRPQSRAALLQILLPLPTQLWQRLATDKRLPVLLRLVDFCDKYPIALPIRSFWAGPFRYCVPTYGKLSTLEVAQAQDALLAARQLEGRDPAASAEKFDEAVAKICRPRRLWLRLLPFARYWAASWDGDERIPYSDAVVPRHTPFIRKADPRIRLAVVLWLVNALAQMRRQFPQLFKAEGGAQRPMAWMLLDLVGGDLTRIQAQGRVTMLTTLAHLQNSLDRIEDKKAAKPATP